MSNHIVLLSQAAAPGVASTGPDYWKPAALAVALVVASMKLKPDYSRAMIWAMRMGTIIIALWILSDYLSVHIPNKWPIPTSPRRIIDVAFPVVFILLYFYLILASQKAGRLVASSRKKAATSIKIVRSKYYQLRRSQDRVLAEDLAWSEPSPLGRLIAISFESCTVDAIGGEGSMRFLASNTSGSDRVVWISLRYEFYYIDKRTGLQTQIALERMVDSPVSQIVSRLHHPLTVSLPSLGEQTTKEVRALAREGHQFTVHVDITLSTITHLATRPQVVWLNMPNQGGAVTVFGAVADNENAA